MVCSMLTFGGHGGRYVFCCSHSHNVAPKGKYIAFVSAEVETENPEAELQPGLALLGQIDEKIIDMYDMYEPVNDSSLDNCFISKVVISKDHSLGSSMCTWGGSVLRAAICVVKSWVNCWSGVDLRTWETSCEAWLSGSMGGAVCADVEFADSGFEMRGNGVFFDVLCFGLCAWGRATIQRPTLRRRCKTCFRCIQGLRGRIWI